MDHQDFTPITIGNSNKVPQTKKIIPKNRTDQHAIKIENETENFSIKIIPSNLSKEIIKSRVTKKFTQKDIAKKLNIQLATYIEIENGKAHYNPATKKIIQGIEKIFSIKFINK